MEIVSKAKATMHYGYNQIIKKIQSRAKESLSKRKNHNLHLTIQNIPTDKKALNQWALDNLNILDESIQTKEDMQDLLLILLGLIASTRTEHTPEESHLAAIRLYCKTNGLLQEFLSMLPEKKQMDYLPNLISSSFQKIDNNLLEESLCSLYSEGYSIWPERLKISTIKELSDLRYEFRTWNLIKEQEQTSVFNGRIQESDQQYIKASTNLDLSNRILSHVANDIKLKAVIDSYLGGKSKLRSASLWITRPSKVNKASSEAAQMFHYDLDTFKWLKVFIYLTDVNEESCANCALPGTHIPGTKNPKLTAKLYNRISDEDLVLFQKEKPKIFIGKAGSLIIGDTKAYHKGIPTKKGERILIQLFYSCTNFALSLGKV